MPPALLAFAPVVAKGVSTLISHKQAGSAAKQAEEQAKLNAAAADTKAKQDWQAQQDSPAAQAARFKGTMQLGRLAGGMGGMDKVPPSIAKYYQSQRTMPTYSGASSYVPQAQKKGSGWDLAAGITDALSQYSPAPSAGASPGLMAAGGAAAQQGGLSALQGTGPATFLSDLTKRVSR